MIGEIPVDVQFIREEQNDRFPQMHVVVLQPLVEKGDLVRFFPVLLIEDEGDGERGKDQQNARQQLILEREPDHTEKQYPKHLPSSSSVCVVGMEQMNQSFSRSSTLISSYQALLQPSTLER